MENWWIVLDFCINSFLPFIISLCIPDIHHQATLEIRGRLYQRRCKSLINYVKPSLNARSNILVRRPPSYRPFVVLASFHNPVAPSSTSRSGAPSPPSTTSSPAHSLFIKTCKLTRLHTHLVCYLLSRGWLFITIVPQSMLAEFSNPPAHPPVQPLDDCILSIPAMVKPTSRNSHARNSRNFTPRFLHIYRTAFPLFISGCLSRLYPHPRSTTVESLLRKHVHQAAFYFLTQQLPLSLRFFLSTRYPVSYYVFK